MDGGALNLEALFWMAVMILVREKKKKRGSAAKSVAWGFMEFLAVAFLLGICYAIWGDKISRLGSLILAITFGLIIYRLRTAKKDAALLKYETVFSDADQPCSLCVAAVNKGEIYYREKDFFNRLFKSEKRLCMDCYNKIRFPTKEKVDP